MAEIPNVRLLLLNRPENVALVRQALSGLAEALGLDPAEFDDVNTAVAEACNNVVLHAYGGGPGPLEVEMHLRPPGLRVVVSDRGSGMRPRMPASEPADGGIGLPMIQALAHSVELRDLGGKGTEVHMEFAAPAARVLEPVAHGEQLQPAEIAGGELSDTTSLAVAPTWLARSVLPRVLCALAARANFSPARISDAQLLSDSLLEHLDGSVSAVQLGFQLSVAPQELELRMGPLSASAADTLLENCAIDGLRPFLERLTDGHRTASDGSRELLALRLVERREQPSSAA